ncbi:uncharacterized protein [Battus philenor]|uniref:uncharacterized protein n=1 Tax=Battus philenor TaxID=42288 RepID=UPI0035D0B0DA
MKKELNKSNPKISDASDIYVEETQERRPLDMLIAEVLSLQVPEEQSIPLTIKITFFDEEILNTIIKTSWTRDAVEDTVIAKGTMHYDPSDYERMSQFADVPMIESDDLFVKIRMQPVVTPSILNAISWDNLPLLTMKLSVDKDPMNEDHHDLLAKANFFKLTLVGCFNLAMAISDFGGTVWTSFHRTLIFKETELWLYEFLREFNWPFQLRISAEIDLSLMAFLDLFRLLYPGEDTVRLAAPLQWFNEATMKEKCNCNRLLDFNEFEPSVSSNNRRLSKISEAVSKSTTIYQRTTGNDDTAAFVLIEVVLRHPMKKIIIPLHISTKEINKMLEETEAQPSQRECTARGQLAKDWTDTVKMAANSLRRISYYGSADFCTFDRQFSSTRTRVEMVTSFCDEAAIYVNNNFVTRDFIQSDNTFKELILMSHACLVREASEDLLPIENSNKLDPLIRAARHARHFQDTYHAAELYFQFATQNPRDANYWRELATCLQDLDQEWADVCLDKSLFLNPRHPLTLLSKACVIFKKNPDDAEPFFIALLYFQPFWLNGMVAANAYFIERENFKMADAIVECIKNVQAQGLAEQLKIARAWEHELGDWWDPTPLLPGMSLYYDTADLLLRIRGIKLAEVCLAQAVHKYGECSAYFHLLALCCRLDGDSENALCYINEGIKKYGEIAYLRTLQAECHNIQRNRSASIVSLEKTDTSVCGSYSALMTILSISSERSRTLLADLLRRQPSAYAWMAFAEEWIMASKEEAKELSPSKSRDSIATIYAIACTTEALKIDKQSGRAWALLARLVKSKARKHYCLKMAAAYGYNWLHERVGSPSSPRQSQCQRLGQALRECQCKIIILRPRLTRISERRDDNKASHVHCTPSSSPFPNLQDSSEKEAGSYITRDTDRRLYEIEALLKFLPLLLPAFQSHSSNIRQPTTNDDACSALSSTVVSEW